MSALTRPAVLRNRLAEIVAGHRAVGLASSFGAEDMVLVDIVAREFDQVQVFTLETGRLPPETLTLMDHVETKYGLEIVRFRPLESAVARYVGDHGLNAMYESVELRKACCAIRKVEPLGRALAGKNAWMTGLRREQAASRATMTEHEFDTVNGLDKYNPLIDWTHDDVWAYLTQFEVPVNALHSRGYPSIGCEPCTRAVKPDEDPRAGRWWWEQSGGQRECGLHVPATSLNEISRIPVVASASTTAERVDS